MSLCYHVTVGDNKKDRFEVEKREDLPKLAFTKFGFKDVPSHTIQVWDSDFEDWCNTSLTALPSKAKVRFVIDRDASPTQPATTMTTSDEQGRKQSLSEPQTFHESTPVKLKEWPLQFEIPVHRFPRTLKEGLEAKKPVQGSLMSQLTSCIYEELTQYTFYPTSSQYGEMARALIRKFPYLGQGLESADALSLWKTAIAYKVRNCRKRIDKDVPMVQAKKTKTTASVGENSVNVTMKKNHWGVANFSPPRPVEEDDESIRSHVEWMKAEGKKTRPNIDKITLLLQKTFSDRRRMVLVDMATADIIKETFPCLFTRTEILNEFERLTEFRIEALLAKGLAKYGDAVLHVGDKFLQKANIMAAISSVRDEDVRAGIKADGVLILTPQIMGEKFSLIGIEKSKVSECATPKYAAFTYSGDLLSPEDCTFEVFVDGVVICTDLVTVFDAVTIVMAAYYIFNLAYPKELCRTLTFVQKVFLNMQDSAKPPAQVLKNSKSPIYRKLWNKIQISTASNPVGSQLTLEDHIQKLLNEKYAFISTKTRIDTDSRIACSMSRLPQSLTVQPMGFALSRGSPYTDMFSRATLLLHEMGIINRLFMAWTPGKRQCDRKAILATQLTLQDLNSVFYILALGVLVALVAVLLEMLIFLTVAVYSLLTIDFDIF